jgi:hypothetical protein
VRQASVDRRMAREMEEGGAALRRGGGVASAATIEANAGGPYGSAQLGGVQAAAEALWPQILSAVRMRTPCIRRDTGAGGDNGIAKM